MSGTAMFRGEPTRLSTGHTRSNRADTAALRSRPSTPPSHSHRRIHNHFEFQRHLLSANQYREARAKHLARHEVKVIASAV